ncbi:MAG: NAD(+)/NADH kinase [Microbacteriaceae bacterium]|nr:NAD(+)/NADH kinase [Microbacteriaceae bacterium]
MTTTPENDSTSPPTAPADVAAVAAVAEVAEVLAPDAARAEKKVAKKTAAKTEGQRTEHAASEKIAAVIFNPTKVDLPLLRAAVAAAEKTAGWRETLWFETSKEDPGQKVAAEVLTHDVDVIMIAGGDGTVRAVVEGMRGSDVPVGLIPRGTGNLLARNLKLTLDSLDRAVSTAFAGKDRSIDLGMVEVEREDATKEKFVFLVMAGLGLDAQMIANTDPDLKQKVGWIAYVDAIRKSLRGNNSINIRYNLDRQGNHTVRVHTVMIGNCGSLPGNILLLPDAAVDDGVFDIVALRPEGFFGWVQIWVKIVWENGVLRRSQVGRKLMGMTSEVRTLRYLQGREFVMRLDRPEEFEVDGDSFGKVVAIKATVEHLGLTVKVPAK